MSEQSEKKPLAPIYKVLLFLIVTFAPVMGCIFSIFVPFNNQNNREEMAALAVEELQKLADQIEAHYEENCSFPADLPFTAEPADCCGAKECTLIPEALVQWREAGITPPGELKGFGLRSRSANEGYLLEAVADFRCDSSVNHRIIIDFLEGPSCTLTRAAPRTLNPFN